MKQITLLAGILLAFVLLFGLAGTVHAVAEAPASAAHAEGDHGGHGEKEADLNPLTWQTDVAGWTLVVFILLVVVLGKFAFGPIAKALDEREKSVADQIASAQQANIEAKNALKQYQQRLAESKDEVRQIIETARKDAVRVADAIVEKAKDAASLEHDRALKEIDAATTNALQSLAEKSATIATDLAGKIIRAEVKPETHRELIQNALGEFAKN